MGEVIYSDNSIGDLSDIDHECAQCGASCNSDKIMTVHHLSITAGTTTPLRRSIHLCSVQSISTRQTPVKHFHSVRGVLLPIRVDLGRFLRVLVEDPADKSSPSKVCADLFQSSSYSVDLPLRD